jgi:hypothetical protein
MRILFDQGVPLPLRQHLTGHHVEVAFELGWSRLTNGELLTAADGRFDVLVTTDKNLRHQQSLSGRKLAVLVLPTTSWPQLLEHLPAIVSALTSAKSGEYLQLEL